MWFVVVCGSLWWFVVVCGGLWCLVPPKEIVGDGYNKSRDVGNVQTDKVTIS